MHWLILIPCYFFTALSTLLALIVVVRLLRINVSVNGLALAAVFTSLTLVAGSLLTDLVEVKDFTTRRMLALGCLSFGLAVLDSVLQPRLRIRLDRELEEL